MSARSYLSIGDVLSLLREEFPDVTISKIRFLESQGLVDPERSPSGYRKFYEHDVERLRWVLRQQREHFLPLKVIRDRLAAAGNGVPSDDGYEGLEPDAGAGPPALDATDGVPGVEGDGAGIAVAPAGGVPGRAGTVEGADVPASGVADRAWLGGGVEPTGPAPGWRGDEPDQGAGGAGAEAVTAGARRAVGVVTAPSAGDGPSTGNGVSEERARPTGGSGGERVGGEDGGIVVRLAAEGANDARHGTTVEGAGTVASPVASTVRAVPAVPERAGAALPGPGAFAPGPPTPRGQPPGPPSGVDRPTGPAVSPGRASAIDAGVVAPPAGPAGPPALRGGPAMPAAVPADVLSPSVSGASFTLEELCAATELTAAQVASLESFGLVAPMAVAGGVYYDEEALTVAKLVVAFGRFGIEPRHLRLYRNAVDREVGLVEQVITPLLRQRNPEARQRAVEAAAELVRLGQGLRSSLVRSELRRQLGT